MQVVVMLPDRIQPVPCSLKEQGGTATGSASFSIFFLS